MDRALFISDLHIVSPEDSRCALFLRLLDKLKSDPVTDLFLVGDIFDLWIADRRYFVERYAPVIERIRDLRAQGCRVHYFEGNHDLDLERFWSKTLGVSVYKGPATFDVAGQRVRVEHGDQMNLEDRGYLFLRWFLRTPVMRAFGRFMPDHLIRWIGERASQASREYTSSAKAVSDENSRNLIRRHAELVHKPEPFQVLITGHVHVEMDETAGASAQAYRMVNLGTWLKKPVVFMLDKAGGQLSSLDEYLSS